MSEPVTEDSYLALTACLQRVVIFAQSNTAMNPRPEDAVLAHWASQMQQLFVFQQRCLLLPAQESRQELETVSALYTGSQDGLLRLFYASPSPADALHWFDYQQEYKARLQQLQSLQQLWQWHQTFYNDLLNRFPHLPLPFPAEAISGPEGVDPSPASGATPQPDLHW
ncbi:hypothetical protein [Rheinheimera sp.]|uniref:hypothetical protein n=1 Tax=Rheinheimera sp. TaxID=1869214 RepID=UPI00307F85AA